MSKKYLNFLCEWNSKGKKLSNNYYRSRLHLIRKIHMILFILVVCLELFSRVQQFSLNSIHIQTVK